MKLIAGLGNPGSEYKNSRHNAGFMVADELSRRWGVELDRKKFQARIGCGQIAGEPVILLEPQTYMNRSGSSLVQAMQFYKLDMEDLMVIVDDMELEPGRLRLREGGSSGGHNGLKDIVASFGTDQFNRLRLGIGRPGRQSVTGYVLERFSAEETAQLPEVLSRAADCVECWIREGMKAAMTRYNQISKEL